MKINEVSKLIHEQIEERLTDKHKSVTTGKILSVGDGIAIIFGIPDASINGLVTFPDGSYGLIIHLDEDIVGVVLMSDGTNLREGDLVQSTTGVISVKVCDQYIGRVVNGVGLPIDGKGAIVGTEYAKIFKIAPPVMARSEISEPLETGLFVIDAMIPIGKGQRELIIGDRQTGKTTIALDTILNQKGKDVYCIYVAIGQKNSTVMKIHQRIEENGANVYTVIVSATASDPVALQFLAPYTAVTIAEYWMKKGKDVFIVYDDLSKHAVAYRTISLLLRRPPGREAYPGDIFYLHSSLLERAAKVTSEYGGGSITAIPIIETQAGDISAYIPTNIISITDGQIFLEQKLFNAGQRPAINCNLSVSRVGGAAQKKYIKQTSSFMKTEIAHYFELKAFSQFGSDFDKNTKYILSRGEKINDLLKQSFVSYSSKIQFVLLVLVKENIIDYLTLNTLRKVCSYLISNNDKLSFRAVLDKIDRNNEFTSKQYAYIIQSLQKLAYSLALKYTNKHDGDDQNNMLEKMRKKFKLK